MKKTLLPLLLGGFVWAQGSCTLTQSDTIKVLWQAYKTPDKIGVKGSLPKLTYTPAHKKGKNFRTLFVGSKVSIDTSVVDSGNPQRDTKLIKFFFSQMTGGKIEGKILSMTPKPRQKGEPYGGTMDIALSMNGKTVTETLEYRYENESFKAQGNIDLLDFAANDALTSINKACYDLHKGKTWSDVSIGFVTTVKATQCHETVKGK